MTELSRRRLLAGAGAATIGGVAAIATAEPAAAEEAVTIRRGDRRYDGLLPGNNFRFVGRPDEVRVVGSTGQVVRAVSDAVRSGQRVAARSGGHCFEGFTADPAVRMLLDLSTMDAVGYDAQRRAFVVEAGATLGHVYRRLHQGWGVTVPAGGCPEAGAGGHFAGGGYGPLSRRYGSVVDHLYAVEVVVVDRDGTARTVVATREPADPNRDLWWAHTGGGGGNFGVVTRYWLRDLPPVPQRMLECVVIWAWDERMTELVFTRILRNFGTWHERNSDPGSPNTGLYAILAPAHRSAGSFQLIVQADADLPDVNRRVTEMVSAVTAGTGTTPLLNERRTLPWLHATTWPGLGEPGDVLTRRYKIKAGYLRRSFNDEQLATIYRRLTETTAASNGGMLFIGYGGQIRSVPPGATAIAQRDVVMKVVFNAVWLDAVDDDANLAWIRGFYRDVYMATGGVPVPNDISDGTYINYPDVDLADPKWNTSGVPWHQLYYKDNYPRLQRVKARWDPRNVFTHALAIEPPG